MEQHIKYEQDLLKTIGINPEEYSISQEYLPNGNSIHNISFQHPSPGKPTILLIHGYFSSNISMFKLYPLLRREFNVISIDLPGFGLSPSPQKLSFSNENEWIKYFTESTYIVFEFTMFFD